MHRKPPKIVTKDGNLVLQAGGDGNIVFEPGQGKQVFIGDTLLVSNMRLSIIVTFIETSSELLTSQMKEVAVL